MNGQEYFGYEKMMQTTEEISKKHGSLKVFDLTHSLLGREIPVLRIGDGEKSILYVGAHHGTEHICSDVLLRFADDFCTMAESGKALYGASADFLLKNRSIYIVPMLNPDGVEISINGIGTDDPLYERLLRMNGGSADFSAWQANGRGVDLNHNYNAAFAEYKTMEAKEGIFDGAPTKYSGTAPESEPETAALCRLIRDADIRSLISFHSQGEEIYHTFRGYAPKYSDNLARLMSNLCGYAVSYPSGSAEYGGLTDWFIAEYDRPAFTLECGKGKNPLPPSDAVNIYLRLRELMFSFPRFV